AGTRNWHAKKNAAPRRARSRWEANEAEARTHPSASRACPRWCETLPYCEGCLAEHQRRNLGFGHGGGLWITQSSCSVPQVATETVAKSLFLITSNLRQHVRPLASTHLESSYLLFPDAWQ